MKREHLSKLIDDYFKGINQKEETVLKNSFFECLLHHISFISSSEDFIKKVAAKLRSKIQRTESMDNLKSWKSDLLLNSHFYFTDEMIKLIEVKMNDILQTISVENVPFWFIEWLENHELVDSAIADLFFEKVKGMQSDLKGVPS